MTKFDLVIKDGRIIDPSKNVDKKADLGVKGKKITRVGEIKEVNSAKVIDAQDRIVTPGLIDLHEHIYYGDVNSVHPDEVGPKSGVTTIVDGGTAGVMNYRGFHEHIVKNSKIRVLAFLHISMVGQRLYWVPGVKGGYAFGEFEDMRLVDYEKASKIAKKRKEVIGIKARADYNAAISNPANTIEAINTAKEAANIANVPLEVHLGGIPPVPKSYIPILEEGDILTHIFRPGPESIFKNGEIRKLVKDAKKRGVLMDAGGYLPLHFGYETAKKAINRGFFPDQITTDIAAINEKGISHPDNPPIDEYGLPIYMSIFLNLGLSLNEIVGKVTTEAAQFLNMEALGTLSEGTVADITVLEKKSESFTRLDATGEEFNVDQKLKVVSTIKDGDILWRSDL